MVEGECVLKGGEANGKQSDDGMRVAGYGRVAGTLVVTGVCTYAVDVSWETEREGIQRTLRSERGAVVTQNFEPGWLDMWIIRKTR